MNRKSRNRGNRRGGGSRITGELSSTRFLGRDLGTRADSGMVVSKIDSPVIWGKFPAGRFRCR